MPSSPTPAPSTANAAPRPFRWKLWLGIAALLLIAFVAWNFSSWQRQAEVGAAYGARIGCSCHYIQGRSLESCATDFEPGMELVSIERIEGEQRIRASVPLLASRTARFAGATGCVLEQD
jgi:hypothetical protein